MTKGISLILLLCASFYALGYTSRTYIFIYNDTKRVMEFVKLGMDLGDRACLSNIKRALKNETN